MSNKRNYEIVWNVTTNSVKLPQISVFNTDKNIFNFKLYIEHGTGKNIVRAKHDELAEYKVVLKTVKKKTNTYITHDGVLDAIDDFFLFDLPEKFSNAVDNYNCQLFLTDDKNTEDITTDDEVVTSSPFTYTVKPSITTDLNGAITSNPDLPIVENLINELKVLAGLTLEDPNTVFGDYEKKVDVPKKTLIEEGKIYLAKSDGTKIDSGTTLPLGIKRENLVVTDNAVTMTNSDVQNITISADTTVTLPSNIINQELYLNVRCNMKDSILTFKNGNETTKLKLAANSYNVFQISANGSDYIIERKSTDYPELTEDEINAGISNEGIDLSNYQAKTDATLTTTSKTITGAINELDAQIDTIEQDFSSQIKEIANDKVDKVEGKSLSTNDYTTEEKNKLSGLENYDDTEIKNTIGTGTLPTSAQTLKGAIAEVFQNASNGKGLIATAITGKGVNASINDTFAQLATKIGEISGGELITNNTSLGEKLYSYVVISDIHHGRTDYNVANDTIDMLEGIDNLNVDFVCSCGDLVVDTPNTRIPVFKALWDSKTDKTLYSCTGNHDALVSEGIWQQNIGHGFRHSFEKNGDVFLFMSVDNDVPITGTPSDFYSESLTWLAEKMQEYKGKRIFLFMHYPLYGYSGLAPGTTYGFSSSSSESSTIAGYLSSIENLIIFSGHSHQPFDTEKKQANYNHIKFYEINTHNSATIGMPSIGLPRNTDLSYITDSNPVEGMVVDVYEKGVAFRGYDFVNKKYMDDYTYYLQVENNNSINMDVSVETLSINESAYADFTVKLNREIQENVTVYLVASNEYISLNKSSLTFTVSNWNTPQTVRVTATHQAENYDVLLSNITLSCEAANNKSITVTVNNIDTPAVTYYSVTNNLTGLTNNNISTQIEENTSYSATLILNNSYQLQTLTVTMGGIDITSTVVDDTSISISSVTGNVVITATATYVETEGENILPVFSNWTADTTLPTISDSNSLSAVLTFDATGKGIKYYIPSDVISANQGKTIVFRADSITLSSGSTNVGIDLRHGVGDIVSMTTNANIGEMTISDTKEYYIRIRSKSSATGLPATLTVNNLRAYLKG